MTDSVKLCLDIRPMPVKARSQVEMHYAQTKDKRHRNVSTPYPKPMTVESPITGTGMQLTTFWDGVGNGSLQSQIVADMNIPNALTAQNCEHGTSVFAAGVAGLYLLKYQMARDGVPVDALDLLNIEHVRLHGATVAYLIPCDTEEQANAAVLQLKSALLILGYAPMGSDSTNVTFYVHRNGYVVRVYQKTDFSHCVFGNQELAETFQSRARRIIRIEVYMQGSFLRDRTWDTLESWRHAYQEDRYELIFRELVRSLFGLDNVRSGKTFPGVILRHKAPRQEAMQRLTDTEREIVVDYLAGTPVDELPTIRDAPTPSARSKAKSKWKKQILHKVRIDITIPWKQHQELRHADLDAILRYPGDYHPDAVTVEHSFCEETWPALLKKLRPLYREAAQH